MARVLIVDDEPDVVEALRLHLKFAGYDPVMACSGEEALRQIKAERPHLILLDVLLPDMSGLEVLRQVKLIDQEVGVIMVTALRNEELGRETLARGAADFIVKPIDLKYLERSMQALLGPLLL